MFFSHNKPDWLYNALPAIYLVAGIATIYLVREPIGLASGGLLILATAAIVFLRVRNQARQATEPSIHTSSILAPPSRLAATTELLRSLEAPKLGHVDIDRQHRSLASRSATLRVSFAHGDERSDIDLLMEELIDAFSQHLEDEAAAMHRLGVARSDAAVEADRERLERVRRDLPGYRVGSPTMEEMIARVATDLVATHLASPHPELPSMEDALKQLRETKI